MSSKCPALSGEPKFVSVAPQVMTCTTTWLRFRMVYASTTLPSGALPYAVLCTLSDSVSSDAGAAAAGRAAAESVREAPFEQASERSSTAWAASRSVVRGEREIGVMAGRCGAGALGG